MAWVDVTGRLTNAGGEVIDATLQPRLWAVPDKSRAFGPVLLTDDEVRADLVTTGSNAGDFTVRVQNIPGIRYTLWLDRLIPGQESEPPANRARNWVQWSEPFHPGEGGSIGNLLPIEYVGAIWIGQSPPPGGPSYPTGTRWLDSNPSSPDFGWIKKWE